MKRCIYFMCTLFMMIIMSKLPIYASELDVVESITAHKRTEGAIKKEEISKVFIGLDEMQTYIEVYEYQYDRNGRVIVETFIDDDPTGSKVTAIEYDENGRKKAVKKAYLYTSDVFFDIIYTYEENGVCVIATDQPSTVTFEKCYQNKYDEHGRLTQVITTGTNIEEGTYICTKYTY